MTVLCARQGCDWRFSWPDRLPPDWGRQAQDLAQAVKALKAHVKKDHNDERA